MTEREQEKRKENSLFEKKKTEKGKEVKLNKLVRAPEKAKKREKEGTKWKTRCEPELETKREHKRTDRG